MSYKILSETISPEKYLSLTSLEKTNLEKVQIIPPTLGDSRFGMIEVTYKTPIYKPGFTLI